MNLKDWMPVAEAAALMGYSPDYFRRAFCAKDAPLIPTYRRQGPGHSRKVIFVLRTAVMELVDESVERPA